MNKLLPWTIFIDMLGYRNINGEINNEDSAKELIDFMISNNSVFSVQDNDEMKNEYKGDIFDLYKYYDIKVLFVSDSLVISYRPNEVDEIIPEHYYWMHSANTLIIIIKRLQTFIYKCLKEKEIFLRGGISNKFSFIENNFAAGEGLIEAYETEAKISKYPRICLAESVSNNENLVVAFNFIVKQIYDVESFLKEENGVYFLDYLKHNICEPESLFSQYFLKNAFFQVHKESIIKKIQECYDLIKIEQDEGKLKELNKILDKYLWLKNYHNESLIDYDTRHLIP